MPTWEWKLFLRWHVFLSINSLGSEHKLYCHLNIVLAVIGGLRAEEVCVCAYIFLPCKAHRDGCSQQTLPTCRSVCCHAEPTFLWVPWEQGQGEWGARCCMSTSALLSLHVSVHLSVTMCIFHWHLNGRENDSSAWYSTGRETFKACCRIQSCTLQCIFCIPLCLYNVLPGHNSLLTDACGICSQPFC